MRNGKVSSKTEKPKAFGLSYLVNEHPPWYLFYMVGFPGRQIQLRFFLLLSTTVTWSSDSPRLIGDYSISLFLTLFLIFSALQFLTMLGSKLAIPFILQIPMCFQGNKLVISEILSTIFFVSEIATLLPTTFGVRLIFFFAVIFKCEQGQEKLKPRGQNIVTTMLKNTLLAL